MLSFYGPLPTGSQKRGMRNGGLCQFGREEEPWCGGRCWQKRVRPRIGPILGGGGSHHSALTPPPPAWPIALQNCQGFAFHQGNRPEWEGEGQAGEAEGAFMSSGSSYPKEQTSPVWVGKDGKASGCTNVRLEPRQRLRNSWAKPRPELQAPKLLPASCPFPQGPGAVLPRLTAQHRKGSFTQPMGERKATQKNN